MVHERSRVRADSPGRRRPCAVGRVPRHALLGLCLLALASCSSSRNGEPCQRFFDCHDEGERGVRYTCAAVHEYTCHGECLPCDDPDDLCCCEDGSPAPLGCPVTEPRTRVDTCELRDDRSSVGCLPDEVCRATPVGLYRCMLSGCDPIAALISSPCRDPGGNRACLPDPEARADHLCWIGGPAQLDEPCASSYDCGRALGCSHIGTCSFICVADEDCPIGRPDDLCADSVCQPPMP